MIGFLTVFVIGLALSVDTAYAVEMGEKQVVEADSDCVVLLHGLVRSSSSMETMASQLQEDGYITVNVDYPSRGYPVEVLADIAVKPALERCGRYRSINFVTHSFEVP